MSDAFNSITDREFMAQAVSSVGSYGHWHGYRSVYFGFRDADHPCSRRPRS